MIRASYKDDCRDCGERIDIGDEIHWNPDDGPRCEDCGPAQPDERRGAATSMEDAPGYVQVLAKRLDDLEEKQSAQYADVAALQAWAEKLSAELGVDGPEVPE